MSHSHHASRDEVEMSPKDKKHKSPKRAESQAEASAKDTTQKPPRPVAPVAIPRGESKGSKDKKQKPLRAAVVTTKKPSRFRFFVDAFLELKKAHWPTRKETVRLSIMVLTVCVVVGGLLGALDFGFMKMMGLLLFGG